MHMRIFLVVLLLVFHQVKTRTINQQVISCIRNTTSEPIVCSCYYTCYSSWLCVPKVPCNCTAFLLDSTLYCTEYWVELNYLGIECFGYESDDPEVCHRNGVCDALDKCSCYWWATGDACNDQTILATVILFFQSNVWFIIIITCSLGLILMLLGCWICAKIRKKELTKEVGEIEKRQGEVEELYVTYFFLEELVAKMKVVPSVSEMLNEFEKILKTKVVDSYQEKKCWKIILKIFKELEEENDEMKDIIEREKMFFLKKSIEKSIIMKKIQTLRFSNYSKLLFKRIKSGKTVGRNEIIEQIDIERILKKVSTSMDYLESEKKRLSKEEKRLLNKKKKVTQEKGSFSEEERKVIAKHISIHVSKGKQKDLLKFLKKKNSILNIELESKKVSTVDEIDFKKIRYNAKNKYRTLQNQRREHIQTVCEELLGKIKNAISSNNDMECEYFCTSLFNKVLIHYFDICSGMKVLNQLMEIMRMILDNNESNVEKVILNVLILLHTFCQICYFKQKEDKIKMNLEQKEKISGLIDEFFEKYAFNSDVQCQCVLIRECLLIIQDTSIFSVKFFNSLNLLKPSLIFFLIKEQFLTFQRSVNLLSMKPVYIEMLKMELKYQLNPVDFHNFLDVNYNNYYLKMFKLEMLHRICIDLLDIERLFDALPQLIPGKLITHLIPQKTILELDEVKNEKKKKKKGKKKDVEEEEDEVNIEKEIDIPSTVVTEEVIVIEEKKKEVKKKRFYGDVFVKFKLVNFLFCWNEIQRFTLKKTKNNRLISKAIEKTHKIAAKAETHLDWSVLKKRFEKKSEISSLIKKLEVTQNKFYLYERYLMKVVCSEKFLELRLPIVKEQYTTFNNKKSIDWLYNTVENERWIIIEGLGGSGKSCLARHLSYRLFFGRNLFCFFIRGPLLAKYYRQWRTSSTSIELKVEILIDTIMESFESKFDELFSSIERIEMKIQLKQIFTRQKVGLIIDAFDEVSVVERNMFVNLLKCLLLEEEIKIAKIILTSRPEILEKYGKSVNMFKRILIDPLTQPSSQKLVLAILRYNKKDDDEEERAMKRFRKLLEVKGEESNFPLISVLLLRRILNTEEKDDIVIMNNNFVLYSSLIFGSILHDVKKFKKDTNSVANASIYWILNLLSIVGYLNQRLPDATRDQIIHILNQDLEAVLDSEKWIFDLKNPIYTIIKSLIRVCGIMTENKNFIIFSHRTIQEWACARFLINPDNNKNLYKLRKKYNNKMNLYFSFWFNDVKWINVYSFYLNYFDPKIRSLKDNFNVFTRVGKVKTTSVENYRKILDNILQLSFESCVQSNEVNCLYANVLEKLPNDLSYIYQFVKSLSFESIFCYFGNEFKHFEQVFKHSLSNNLVKIFDFISTNEVLVCDKVNSKTVFKSIDLRDNSQKVLLELKKVSNHSYSFIKEKNYALVDNVLYDLKTKKTVHEFKHFTFSVDVKGDKMVMYRDWTNEKELNIFDLNSLKFEDKILIPFEPEELHFFGEKYIVTNDSVFLSVIELTKVDDKHVVHTMKLPVRGKSRLHYQREGEFFTLSEIGKYYVKLCIFSKDLSKMITLFEYRFIGSEVVTVKFFKNHICVFITNCSIVVFDYNLNLIKSVSFSLPKSMNHSASISRNRVEWRTGARGFLINPELPPEVNNAVFYLSQVKSFHKLKVDFEKPKMIEDINKKTTHLFNTFSGFDLYKNSVITLPKEQTTFNFVFNAHLGMCAMYDEDNGLVKFFKVNKEELSFEELKDKEFNIGSRSSSFKKENYRIILLNNCTLLFFDGSHLYCFNEKGVEVKELLLFSNKPKHFKRSLQTDLEYDGKLIIGRDNTIVIIDTKSFSKMIEFEDKKMDFGNFGTFYHLRNALYVMNMSGNFFRMHVDFENSKIDFETMLPKSFRFWNYVYPYSENVVIGHPTGSNKKEMVLLNLITKDITRIKTDEIVIAFAYIKNSEFFLRMGKKGEGLDLYDVQSGKVVYKWSEEEYPVPQKFIVYDNDILITFPNTRDIYYSNRFGFQKFKMMKFDFKKIKLALMYQNTSVYMHNKELMKEIISRIKAEKKLKKEDFQREIVNFIREMKEKKEKPLEIKEKELKM